MARDVRSNASNIFKWVVDDVIAKVKPEFVQEGIEESVLDELRSTWEAKLNAGGLLSGGGDDAAAGPSAPGYFGGASAVNRPGMAFPGGLAPNPAAAAVMAQHLQQLQQIAQQQKLQGAVVPANPLTSQQMAQMLSRFAAQQQQGVNPATMNYAAAQAAAAAKAGVKRKEPDGGHVPQHDGAADGHHDEAAADASEEGGGGAEVRGVDHAPNEGPLAALADASDARRRAKGWLAAAAAVRRGGGGDGAPTLRQADGGDDEDGGGDQDGDGEGRGDGDGEGDGEEQDGEGEGAGDGDARPPGPQGDEVLSEDSEPDDDEEEITNFLCCQFEKVNRVKAKYKLNLRDGVFRVNGRDYLFKRATGEWSWV
ncbi:hypothetical protein FOA52_001729 [Chlamydomonas sp. UWO 241]|nr:hypothetical protein FOA52_001729 [Chlamydomonas sp. UWO 241]